MASNAIASADTGETKQMLDPRTLPGLKQQLEKGANEMRAALPAHIDAEKFQRTVLTAVQSNPALLEANRPSLFLAVMKAAQDGLLPDGREAAFVTFNTRVRGDNDQWVTVQNVQYMPMVYGLRKKILQSGEIRDITAKVVYLREYQDETFYYEEGTDAQLRHKPNLLLTDDEATDANIVAAYSIATYMDGTKSYEVMTRAEINKVRQASQTGAEGRTYAFGRDKGKPIEPKGPWVDWFGEMAKKTVMRRHAKTLPMSGDILDVENRDDDAILAQSAKTLLASVDPEPPTPALPTRGQVIDHDPRTGEIIDQQDEQRAAEELDRQTYAEVDGTQDTSGEQDDMPPSERMARELIDRADNAADGKQLQAVQDDATNHSKALSDAQYERVSGAIFGARSRLGITTE